MNSRILRVKSLALGFPALAGFMLLYLYPFIRTLWYSVVSDTYNQSFVFIKNYINVLGNTYYQLALRNTLIFSFIGVTFIAVLSIVLSLGIIRLGNRFVFVKNMLIAPMIMPTASVVFVWQLVFQDGVYGTMVRSMASGKEALTVLPLYLLYIWKNTGLNIILLTAAMAAIHPEVREAAVLDGACGWRMHRWVTFPLITPSLLFVIVISFVNVLKSFRESYLYFPSDYPPDAAYTVQYYMNNHFHKLNYPNLTAGSVIFTLIIVAILLVMYRWENAYNEKIY